MAEIIYGRNPVSEAIRGNVKIESLLIQDGIDGSVRKIIGEAKEQNIRVKYAPKRDLDRMADGNHQGIIAFTETYEYSSVEDIIKCAEFKDEKPFVIILDGIEDPHNLGAIIRTGEAAGVHGIIIPGKRSASVNETVVKTAFNQRRKTLRNSLKPLLGKDCEIYSLPIFDKRPEQLSVEQFIDLTNLSTSVAGLVLPIDFPCLRRHSACFSAFDNLSFNWP